jgi:hypothetical protein
MDEIAAYKNSKFRSSIMVDFPSFKKIKERGVKVTLHEGNNKVNTCYTANFLSAA